MQPEDFIVVNREEINECFVEIAGAVRRVAHDEGLPALECLPSLKGYAMLATSWDTFRKTYIDRVREACRLGAASYVQI